MNGSHSTVRGVLAVRGPAIGSEGAIGRALYGRTLEVTVRYYVIVPVGVLREVLRGTSHSK